MRWLAPIIVAVSLAIPFGSRSFAQDQLWYYCATTHQFYPYTQRCSVPWQKVPPYNPIASGQPTPLQQPAPNPAQDQAEDAAQRQQEEQAAQAKTQADAQAQAEAHAQREAYEHDRAIEKAKSKGYELVSGVQDLALDGKELAAREAKIQVAGVYRRFGENVEYLYASEGDAIADDGNKFPVLTADAQRALRKALMNYMCQSQIGCQVEVGGHVTMCSHVNTLLADAPSMPCLNIEVAIVYWPGD